MIVIDVFMDSFCENNNDGNAEYDDDEFDHKGQVFISPLCETEKHLYHVCLYVFVNKKCMGGNYI